MDRRAFVGIAAGSTIAVPWIGRMARATVDDQRFDPSFGTATQATQAIQTGVISSRELVEHVFRRIKKFNPKINAFITLIEERMETHEVESAKDYRLEKLHGSDLYLTPADARAEAAMDASFRKLTGRTRGEPATLNHKGRSIIVPQAALGVARFTFADLCTAPLGSLATSDGRPCL